MYRMNYLWIDEKNRSSFKSVLPKAYTEGKENICVGAYDDDGFVCGALCYRYAHYQYDVLWIYVAEEKRLQGTGSGLLDLLFRIVGTSGEIYPISARFEPSAEESLYGFFLSYSKMETAYSHDRFYVDPREIRGIKLPGTGTKEPLRQDDFFKLPMASQRKILGQLEEECDYIVPDYEDWKRNAVSELCRCILLNGSLMDLLFVHKRSDGNLELSYLYSKYPKGLVELLTAAAWDTESYYPKAKLVFDAVNEESASMAEKLFPKAVKVPVYEAEW